MLKLSKILKDQVIGLTTYEKRSLYRFLGLYLASVFLLLAVIGYLFYQNNASMMSAAMRFEMLYQARMIESKLIMAEEKGDISTSKESLEKIHTQRFKVGFFDKAQKPLYSEITESLEFNKGFYTSDTHCYSVVKYPSDRLKIGYIVLREDELKQNLHRLRWRIIYYLVGLFLFMAMVGYFLSRLFLKPVREKIEALDRFIEDTTHELNTPVSAILMTVQSLKGVETKKLDRLKVSAQRLSTMYDTLSYSLNHEAEAKKEERFDLRLLLQERMETMKAVADSRKITMRETLESCLVYMPKEEMRRVVDNLLSNAIKYSNPHDNITVILSEHMLQICDTGIGIEPSKQEDIFRRYHRFNKERGGFGIGLSIVLAICKKYHISVSIDSEKGRGSCFALDISAVGIVKNQGEGA